MTTRRRRTTTCLAVAGVLTVAGGYWYLTAPRYEVPVPPADASPQQVAMAYMRALDAHDGSTAYALSTPAQRAETQIWLSETAGLTHPTTSAPVADTAEAGLPRGTETVDVAVTFDYQQNWWTDDPSLGDGPTVWGYVLVHEHGRWLVDDCGTG